MFRFISIFLLPVLLAGGIACRKTGTIPGTPYSYINLTDLRATVGNKKYTDKAPAKHISGIVISNAAAGNVLPGHIILQQGSAGITIVTDSSAPITWLPGDSLVVDMTGATLSNAGGNLTISGLPLSAISKKSSGIAVNAVQLSVANLVANFSAYEGTLIQVTAADVSPNGPGQVYAGDYTLNDASGSTMQLHTYATAAFAGQSLPPIGTFTGIAAWSADGATPQLRMRTGSDVQTINIIPAPTPIVISGFLSDPRGSDEPADGTVSGIVTHHGGYEYVQLMATRDIDFSVTPYSVVTANNGTATANGWSQGGTLTYKFDLTTGTAKKGSFFYVGSSAKVIAGYTATGGKSTDISGANWVRAIAVNANNAAIITGDGFGNSNAGFMGNSSPADGIAVFAGTTVTPASIPLDAVFYGTTVGTTLSGANGYLVPSTDHYASVGNGGQVQAFFGQGSNTYVFAQPNTDVSSFSKLGGVYDSGAASWLSPRQTTLVDLPLNATLADIENSTGVTSVR